MTAQETKPYLVSEDKNESSHGASAAITFCYRRGRIHIHRSVVASMQNPAYIRLLIHREKRVVIIQPCDEKERDAIKVPQKGEGRYSSVFINSMALLTSITELMGWSKKRTYRVAGEYLPKDHIAVFVLNDAVILKETGEPSCETI